MKEICMKCYSIKEIMRDKNENNEEKDIVWFLHFLLFFSLSVHGSIKFTLLPSVLLASDINEIPISLILLLQPLQLILWLLLPLSMWLPLLPILLLLLLLPLSNLTHVCNTYIQIKPDVYTHTVLHA